MVYLALTVGGIIGGLLRYAVSLIPTTSAIPAGVLVINLLGSLILGALYGLANVRHIQDWVRAGIGAGVIGSFTTFSTFCVGADAITHFDYTALYIVLSAAGGPFLAYMGDLAVIAYARRSTRLDSIEEGSL